MRFVKLVTSTICKPFRQLVCNFFVKTTLYAIFNKLRNQDSHFLWNFVSDSSSKHICCTEVVSCYVLYNLHRLFLIEKNSVSILQRGNYLWVKVSSFFCPCSSIYEAIHHAALDSRRSVQGNQRYQIENILWLNLSEQLSHSFALDLKTAHNITTTQHLKS